MAMKPSTSDSQAWQKAASLGLFFIPVVHAGLFLVIKQVTQSNRTSRPQALMTGMMLGGLVVVFAWISAYQAWKRTSMILATLLLTTLTLACTLGLGLAFSVRNHAHYANVPFIWLIIYFAFYLCYCVGLIGLILIARLRQHAEIKGGNQRCHPIASAKSN